MRTAILACLLLFSGLSHADTEVLVDRVPKGAEPAMLVSVIERALVGRGWAVTGVSPTSVSATLEHSSVVRGRITISLYGQAIVYEGSAARRTVSGPQQAVLTYERPIPNSWLRALRNDISKALATVPDR